jgi:hypothetical protein
VGTPSRVDRIAPWGAGAVLALPVLVAHYPPMMDLPAHEAAVGLLRHWSDPRFVPPHVYALSFGQPNQVFYFLILALAAVFPIGTASKLVVAATLWLLPVAAARFASHLGVTRWSALVVAPVGMGWMFFWGLLANIMGLALLLCALPALDRFVARPTLRGFGVVTGWLLVLHFVHDLSALAAAVTLVVLMLSGWRGWRDFRVDVARVAPAFLVSLLIAASRALEERRTRPGDAILSMPSFGQRLRTFPDSIFAGTGWVSGALLVVAALPLVLFAFERRAGRRALPSETPGAPRLHRYRFEILAGVFVAFYFLAPGTINWTANSWSGVSQINQRFLPLAWSVLAVALAPPTEGAMKPPWRLPRLLAGFLPLAPILVTWPEFAASDRAYRDLDAIIAHMEPGEAQIVLELGPVAPDALFSPVTAGGHIVATIGGRTLFDYTRSPTAPVVQRPEAQWNEVLERIDRHTYRFVPAHDLRRFRYVVLHTVDPGIGELTRLALEPDARTVFQQGDFTLLESTLPRVAVDAPDDPFPLPHPPSLDERAMETAKRLGATPEPRATP